MMAEQKPICVGIGEGSEEAATTGDTEGDVHEGRMELSSIMTLLNSISCFGLLSSSGTIKSELVHRYCRTIDEILMLLRPVLEEAVLYVIIPDAKLTEVLIELDSVVNEARELLGSWNQMMSTVYFLMQNEPIIANIQASAVIACQLLKSSYPPTVSAENVESLKKKIQLVHHEKILDKIKEAIEDRINKRRPRSEHLEKISSFLNLSSNQELLMEAVALDKLKSKVGRADSLIELEPIENILELISYMHECLVTVKQLHSINGVPIPPDFCCPLSLELMSDPVIVASGQTYERAFIKKWLDQGLNVCPKTRQTLAHGNLIPNYTVKALIENWCESNNIKLADPARSMNLNLPSVFISPTTPEKEMSSIGAQKDLASSNGIHQEGRTFRDTNECDGDFSRMSLSGSEENKESRSEQRYVASGDQTSTHSTQDFSQDGEHHEEVSDARTLSRVHSDLTHSSSDASGEVTHEAPTSSAPQAEPELISKFTEVRSRSRIFWRRPSDRFTPKTISSSSFDSRPDLSDVEAQVQKLIEDLKCDSANAQRAATEELRLLAKHNMENRIVIANCGAIPLLVNLLNSTDPKTQENAVTALLNLSINDNNKTAIANADAIDPLVHVLETGTPEAKENSAATLFSLSVIEENKVRIGRSGAIKPLVDLLGNGTRRGKKDAATALFNLSIFHENKAKIVQAGAVRHLVELMDPAAGMVDKAVAVLANLATIPEGRTAIGIEGGIPVLVEVVELGSARGKENAAAALLQLCTNSNRFCSLVLQEGAVPPLVALSQLGTPRAKEKAQALLSNFRTQRHGNAGRS